MKLQYILPAAAIVLVLIASACGTGPTPTPRPVTPTSALPIFSPTPEQTVTPTPVPATPTPPTPTLAPVQAKAKQDVNVRKGPGVEFASVGKLANGATAAVLGKSQDGKWYQLAYPDASNPGWVAATFLELTGPVDKVQVVTVAPLPTSTRGGPAPTKAAAATPTQALPPPRGGVGFVSYEEASAKFIVNTISVESHGISGFKRLGPKPGPFDIRNNTSAPPFAWSPDGSKLAYVFSPDGTTDVLRLVNRATPDDDKSLDSHPCISSPTWQADNNTIVYIGMDDSNCTTQWIYKINSNGSNPGDRQFFRARSGESLRGLYWGNFLLFVSNLSGVQEIWRMNLDASGPGQLTNDKRENGSPAWNPGSTKFAYYSRQADGSFQIVVANADGTNPHKLTSQGNNFSPTWSTDGNWIAFASTRGGRYDVYIMDKNGGQVQLLTDKSPTEGFLPGSWR